VTTSGYNYGNHYGLNEACSLTLYPNGIIHSKFFATEFSWDGLTVNGVKYSGEGLARGPTDITVTAPMEWRSDNVGTNLGWKICTGPSTGDVAPAAAPAGDWPDEQNSPFPTGFVMAIFGGVLGLGALGTIIGGGFLPGSK